MDDMNQMKSERIRERIERIQREIYPIIHVHRPSQKTKREREKDIFERERNRDRDKRHII